MITTATNKSIDTFNIKIEDIDIHDIAHSLSLKCRFGGFCKKHYSVAQHSIHASYKGTSPLESMFLLMHDAAEAYMPDFLGPDKKHYYVYQPPYYVSIANIERSILCEILFKYSLSWSAYYEHKDYIKKVDMRLRATEARDLMPSQVCDAEPYDMEIVPMSPECVEAAFLDRFMTLQRQICSAKENQS